MKRSFVPTLIVALAVAVITFLAPGVVSAQPGISVSPTSLDFGQVVIGQSSTLQLTVTNTGVDPLEVYGIQVFTPIVLNIRPVYPGRNIINYIGSTVFADQNNLDSPVIVPAGQSVQIGIEFAPNSVVRAFGYTLFVKSNAPVSSPGVNYTGEGVYSITPPTSPFANGRASVLTTLNFGDIVLGQTAIANLVVGNTGTGDLFIMFLEVTGGSGFTNVNVTGSTWTYGAPIGLDIILPAGQSAAIPIQLTPVALGPIRGSFQLYILDSTLSYNGVTITFTGNVVVQPPPVVVVPPPPPPPPEKPGVSFNHDFSVAGDSANVALYLAWKVIWPNLDSVIWDLGNGRTAKGQNVRVMLPLGTNTIKVSVKTVQDCTYTATQTLTFAQPVAVVIAPTVPTAELATPTFTTGLVGSSMAKSEGLAGGGGKKKSKRQVVPASKVAVTTKPTSWGEIKNRFAE